MKNTRRCVARTRENKLMLTRYAPRPRKHFAPRHMHSNQTNLTPDFELAGRETSIESWRGTDRKHGTDRKAKTQQSSHTAIACGTPDQNQRMGHEELKLRTLFNDRALVVIAPHCFDMHVIAATIRETPASSYCCQTE